MYFFVQIQSHAETQNSQEIHLEELQKEFLTIQQDTSLKLVFLHY